MVQISNLPSKPTNNQLASVNSGQNHSNLQQQQHHFNNNLLVAAESSPMMLRPSEITSTRSHSISIFPSSVNSSERSSLTSDLFPPPSQQSAIPVKQQQQQQQQTDSSDIPEKQSYQQDQQQHSSSDSSIKNSNINHHNYHHNFAHINLTSRQISRDKTEPIAHLDPRSIQTAESEAELHSSSSSAQKKACSSNLNLHLQHPTQPSPVISSVPTSILRESSGGSSAHGSYYELKQLQHNSGVMGAAGVRYLPKAPSSGNLEKRIIFDTGPPPPPPPPPLPQFPLQAIRRRWSSYQTQTDPNLDPVDGIVALLSAIYCKIIVVIGLCFPMAEVISHRIPISWYEGFYLYLYTGSILFLIFVYIFLLNRKRRQARANRLSRLRNCAFRLCRIFTSGSSSSKKSGKKKKKDEDGEVNAGDDSRSGSSEEGGNGDGDDDEEEEEEPQTQIQCGSFYLRVGAVTFGVGSMIYSGLEFGQFFELESKEHCYSFMYGLTPGSHMIFTFIQLYFIFMNSRVVFARHKLIARFGLMHMIGTNICVWLHVLIQETKHQIMTMVETNSTDELSGLDLTHAWDHVDDVVEELSEDYLDSVSSHPVVPHRTILGGGGGGHHASMIEIVNQTLYSSTTTVASAISDHSAQPLPGLHRVVRSLNDHYITHSDCRRSNIIGELVTDASQFLFPCTIEYSLICAAILYIMWKSISEIDTRSALRQGGLNPKNQPPHSIYGHVSTGHHHLHHQKHHYQVDCAKAHKGLFTGIFLMVICIISLILFFVFIKKDQFRNLAVLQAHIVELFIYCINAIACLIALFQVRELNYNRRRGVELDNILLIIAQSGLCIFTMFSIIGAQFISQLQNTRLVLINAFACLIQSTLQSVFILDASKRKASTADQVRRKPGREMVTFLLVCNFSMWAINTLETRRAESNPVQMSFYGFWAWTIITHVTMPLTIFYRFHSTVCLCEIWKGTYKIKSEYL